MLLWKTICNVSINIFVYSLFHKGFDFYRALGATILAPLWLLSEITDSSDCTWRYLTGLFGINPVTRCDWNQKR